VIDAFNVSFLNRVPPQELRARVDEGVMSGTSATRDPMPKTRGKRGSLAWVFALSWLALGPVARAELQNPTGLPLYPNLTSSVLDNVLRTDGLGHWCMHLSARSGDSLAAVEDWYRRALVRASETDVSHDRAYVNLDGIKLAHDVDSVAIYRVAGASATYIEIARCSPGRAAWP